MNRDWDAFYKEKMTKLLTEKKTIIDIGGGLRLVSEKGNRYDKSKEWMRPLVEKVDYKVMDPVNTYKPDVVGDIHKMPFKDNSLDAIICIAVLEHVENPIKACEEMFRVLKPGGYCFLFVPFLYYYHAERGYYGDYWRFTKDSIKYIFRDFSKLEISSSRGAIETLVHLTPLGRFTIFNELAHILDKITGKIRSNQVSGYYIFVQK